MDLEEFDLGVTRSEKKDEKVYYVILVQYKELKYEVNRRYSEFEELNCELLNFGFSALPNLPKKKLMSYQNIDYIKYREKCLNKYIQNLFMRPDIRCCAVFLNFLKFYEKINMSVEIVRTKLVNSIGTQKFSLVDMYINEKYHFIITIYEDRSSLSKLGKLWSIIEPDIVGEIKVFSYNNDLSSSFTEKYKEQTIYKAKNIICVEEKDQVLISGDDGHIHIYQIDTEAFTLTFIKQIQFHNDTILKMMKLKNTFCTCGYDNAFRLCLLNDPKEECKIISGGRCNKRLENDKITTCHLFEHNNIVLGTDNSLFFIYNLTNNPPTFLDTKKIRNGRKINCFANSDKYLFIGYDHIIACYNYQYNYGGDVKHITGEKGNLLNVGSKIKYSNGNEETKNGLMQNEKKIIKLVIDNNISAQYISPLMYDNNVRSLCVVKSKKILIAGYEDAIIIWSILHGLIISSVHGHTSGVYCLKYMNSCDLFLSGGNGGNLKIWNTNLENLKFWKPKNRVRTNNEERSIKNSKYQDYTNNQNNFIFNESDNEHDHSDYDKNSSLSEPISIDNVLDTNVKTQNYQVYDTSDYKQNIINYNLPQNNTTSFNNQPYIFNNNEDTNQYAVSTNFENDKNIPIYNIDSNQNNLSTEHFFNKEINIDANPNDMNYDFTYNQMNKNQMVYNDLGDFNIPMNLHNINNMKINAMDHVDMNQMNVNSIHMEDMNFNDVHIENNDLINNINIESYNNKNNMMYNLNIDNWNDMNVQNKNINTFNYGNTITVHNPTELDNTKNIKKGIVQISDEEEEEDDNDDLISAFR